MIKSLCDICLSVILVSLDKVPDIGVNLPTMYKEMLLERLGWHDLLTPEYLPHVSSNLLTKSLRRVNFYKCEQITDSLLKLIKDSGCRLRDLTIDTCANVTDIGFQSVTYKQDSLENLKLHWESNLTNAGLQYMCSPVLVKLDLNGCYNVTFEGVHQLVERNKAIKELHLTFVDQQGLFGKIRFNTPDEYKKQQQTQLIKVAASLNDNLEEFEFDSGLNDMNDDDLVIIASYCHNLKRLNLSNNSQVTGQAIKKISMSCLNIESCHLPSCLKLCQPLYSEALLSLPQSIEQLSLGTVSLADVECFQRLRNLTNLKLCLVEDLDDETLDRILVQVGNSLTCLELRHSLWKSNITSRALVSVAEHCLNLEVLVLDIFALMEAVHINALMPIFTDQQRAMKLTTLSLRKSEGIREIQSTENVVVEEVVRSCRKLEGLDLQDHAYITDAHLVTLAENCHMLSHVVLRGCKEVTDIGICAVAMSCPLERIDIESIENITDKSIFTLANTCHYLKEIKISGRAIVSPEAIRFITDSAIPRLFLRNVSR